MIMLYAKEIYYIKLNEIEKRPVYIDRLTVKKDDILEVGFDKKIDEKTRGYLLVKDGHLLYRITPQPSKNFYTVSGFFDYIREYSEIDFETKEVPTKMEIKVGDIYSYGKDFYYVVFCIRDDIENKNDKRIDFLRIYQENLVGMDRNENLSFLKDMDYIGNCAVSISKIFDSIESIISLTN